MAWLNKFPVAQVVAGVCIVAVMIVVSYWRSRSGRGDVYRRYIPGLALVFVGGLLGLAHVMSQEIPSNPRFTWQGFASAAVAGVGYVMVLIAWRRSKQEQVGRHTDGGARHQRSPRRALDAAWTAQAATPWRSVQRAAWDALKQENNVR